jgi:hypothetical protein
VLALGAVKSDREVENDDSRKVIATADSELIDAGRSGAAAAASVQGTIAARPQEVHRRGVASAHTAGIQPPLAALPVEVQSGGRPRHTLAACAAVVHHPCSASRCPRFVIQ